MIKIMRDETSCLLKFDYTIMRTIASYNRGFYERLQFWIYKSERPKSGSYAVQILSDFEFFEIFFIIIFLEMSGKMFFNFLLAA